MKIDYTRFAYALDIIKEEHKRYNLIKKNLSNTLKIITKEYRKNFKKFKIVKVQVSETGGLCITTNQKTFMKNNQDTWVQYSRINFFKTCNFTGNYIWICTKDEGVAWNFRNNIDRKIKVT